MSELSVLEICAGGGGQSLGLERAGFLHAGAIDNEHYACQTLAGNRPGWSVVEADVSDFDGRPFSGVDLLAGGIPCPPFSIAGKQLGESDERDLFPHMLRLIGEVRPTAVLIENVAGFASERFRKYRETVIGKLEVLGYDCPRWTVLNACDFGVPQLRPRFVLVALRPRYSPRFQWPSPKRGSSTVGTTVLDLMSAKNWPGAESWAKTASSIAPTIVGGSKKHGGPDLGPTRARKQWLKLRVDGLGIANAAPSPDFPTDGSPRLTTRMVARLQGFPDDWCFAGSKTAAYRQVGNAFPPPVAHAVGNSIAAALDANRRSSDDDASSVVAVATST